MNHLTLFQTTSEYEIFKSSDIFITPNVSYCKDEDVVHYNPKQIDYSKEYLTIENIGDNALNVSMVLMSDQSPIAISYKASSSDWVETSDVITVNPNESIYVKATLTPIANGGIGTFVMNGDTTCAVKGNIMSLLFGDDFKDKTDLSGYDWAFCGLFAGCLQIVDASNLILAATTLSIVCYHAMFHSCTNLVKAPLLLATTLADECCVFMFGQCTSLTKAPKLLATRLANGCYAHMFSGCANLDEITMLATDGSGGDWTLNWVNGVSSSGTFIKHPSMTSLPSGVDGIPNGWTVVDYAE